jgi:hypothetical protein
MNISTRQPDAASDDETPIFVTGPARSGTTWMQWFLSQHPRIQIFGQPPPAVTWERLWEWRELLLDQSRWSLHANAQVGYSIPHYAGSPPDIAQAAFRRFLRDYLGGFGNGRPRWGLKWIDLCARSEHIAQVEAVWPEVRWIVCLRDPFATIASTKNTFARERDPAQVARDWVASCRFAGVHDPRRTALVQIDQLVRCSTHQRRQRLNEIIALAREPPHARTDEFIQSWPIVHKAVPDEHRQFSLTPALRQNLLECVEGLAECMTQIGYAASKRPD